jgi:hypothetical protein
MPSPGRRPASAPLPRIATGRHPRAVGTYGPACLAWAEGKRLHPRTAPTRYWQRYAAYRALEHDRDGWLVWRTVVISAPRQSGKSWLERDVLGWRMTSADLFGGDEQAILHVAHKLTAAQEVWRPAARYWAARPRSEAAVRWANGEQQIELADGSRWLIQAANDGAGVSFALAMALIDEGWRVARRVYEGGIEPTMADSVSPQAWLVSTAGTAESDLMLTYRAGAIAQVAHPADTLILEWSAPTDGEREEAGLAPLDIDDPRVWRAAQAHWDDRREAAISKARRDFDERTFRQQYLNQWIPTLSPPALAPGTWDRVATRAAPSGALAFGGEVAPDHSRAVVVAYGGGVAEVIAEVEPGGGLAAKLADLAERHRGVVGLDVTGEAAGAADTLKGLGKRLARLGVSQSAAAAGQVYDALTASPAELRLRDHLLFQTAIAGARRRRNGTWDRDAAGLTMGALTSARWASSHATAEAPEPDRPAVYALCAAREDARPWPP